MSNLYKDTYQKTATDTTHTRLVKCLRIAPSRQWTDEYFDLLAELLEFTGLRNEDPRLTLSITDNKLPVTINSRYVLCAFRKNKPATGFIFPSEADYIDKFKMTAFHYWQFAEKESGRGPYFFRFEGHPMSIFAEDADGRLVHDWQSSVIRELGRGSYSHVRRFHQPIVYQMAVDRHLRADIFSEAFG